MVSSRSYLPTALKKRGVSGDIIEKIMEDKTFNNISQLLSGLNEDPAIVYKYANGEKADKLLDQLLTPRGQLKKIRKTKTTATKGTESANKFESVRVHNLFNQPEEFPGRIFLDPAPVTEARIPQIRRNKGEMFLDDLIFALEDKDRLKVEFGQGINIDSYPEDTIIIMDNFDTYLVPKILFDQLVRREDTGEVLDWLAASNIIYSKAGKYNGKNVVFKFHKFNDVGSGKYLKVFASEVENLFNTIISPKGVQMYDPINIIDQPVTPSQAVVEEYIISNTFRDNGSVVANICRRTINRFDIRTEDIGFYKFKEDAPESGRLALYADITEYNNIIAAILKQLGL